MVTNYQRGANFERRVVEHLKVHLAKEAPHEIKWYVMRSAGSRGDIDIILTLTDTTTDNQRSYGFQCRLDPPSFKARDTWIAQVKHETGIQCFFVTRAPNRSIVFYPTLEVGKELTWKI